MKAVLISPSQATHLIRLLNQDKFWGDEIVSDFEKSHNVDCDLLITKLESI